ncbi:hypothetical protein QO010_003091 [Caulobacter ginsengisoli]|uniref:Transposase n=1 Tax=Caulobacter ginsengisoli TaxID=400775 RepID=A0ABU0ITI9_9CAUL|nr:hypothetical protein [Caulobacter ginsengisoli]MDQ0465304.1 hypothetical protein [Caulobacter ginsengisoli]
MKLWDLITGSRPAPKGVRRLGAAALRERLMALNRDTAPWKVRSGAREHVDLVGEWKIVDARWYEIFAKAGLKRTFKVLMKFDAEKHEVRAVDQAWEIEWKVGGHPVLTLEATAFRGQQWEKSFEAVYAFREDLSYGEIYSYRFDSEEIKDPLRKAVHDAGWGWRGVAFSKL